MKIIGKINNDMYIAEVGYHELSKYFNLYYSRMSRPNVGDVFDLGKSHDFADDVRSSVTKLKDCFDAAASIGDAVHILNQLALRMEGGDLPEKERTEEESS